MVTIKDIAKIANISVTTVSRALNDFDDVNINTKHKIQQIAKDLGYFPNRSAQSLAKSQSQTLVIILSGLLRDGGKDNIVYRTLAGMYQYAETVNYEVNLFTTSSAHQKEKSYFNFCREHNIGGAILQGIRLDDLYLEEIVNSSMPCVLIDIDMQGHNVCGVSINNKQASEDAVAHLIKANHRNIGMIAGIKEAYVSIEREKGYICALSKVGIPYRSEWVVPGNFLEDEAYKQVTAILRRYPEITALFCASDMMAIGAYRAIKDLGKKVPEDISIVGFDNIPFSEHISPSLTTIDQDFFLMGHEAAKELLAMIEGKSEEKKIVMTHKLLDRGSVRAI